MNFVIENRNTIHATIVCHSEGIPNYRGLHRTSLMFLSALKNTIISPYLSELCDRKSQYYSYPSVCHSEGIPNYRGLPRTSPMFLRALKNTIISPYLRELCDRKSQHYSCHHRLSFRRNLYQWRINYILLQGG